MCREFKYLPSIWLPRTLYAFFRERQAHLISHDDGEI